MNYNQPELQERLAAEYVLGTLTGPARRRFIKLMQQNAGLRAAVVDWETRLNPLAQGIAPIDPPPYIWHRITARIGLSEPARAKGRERHPSLWESLFFWRPFAVACATLAFGLFAYVNLSETKLPESPNVVAVLAGKDAKPVMLVSSTRGSNTLTVTVLGTEQIPADRDFELWALPDGGAPKSLGLVARNGETRLTLPTDGLQRVPAVAISLEPKGGSRTGAPTGPVLYQGEIVRVGA